MKIGDKEYKIEDQGKSGGLLLKFEYNNDVAPTIIVAGEYIIELHPHVLRDGGQRIRIVAHKDVKIIGSHRIKIFGLQNCLEGATDVKEKNERIYH